jgi:hypothetical protein
VLAVPSDQTPARGDMGAAAGPPPWRPDSVTRTEFYLAAWLSGGLLLALIALSFQPTEAVLAITGGPCPG